MNIKDIKELSKLIDLCRKKGIDSIEIDNIKLKLGTVDAPKVIGASGPELMPEPSYSSEDILNWSSTPLDGVG